MVPVKASKDGILFSLIFMVLLLTACSTNETTAMMRKQNPALYFEIPVIDMQRAMAFYRAVFEFDFEVEEIHGNQMAMLPFFQDGTGISGALAYGEIYQPSKQGTLIYLFSPDIEAGGKVLFPKTKAGDYAWVAEIEDSEGNRIGLQQPIEE